MENYNIVKQKNLRINKSIKINLSELFVLYICNFFKTVKCIWFLVSYHEGSLALGKSSKSVKSETWYRFCQRAISEDCLQAGCCFEG